MIILDCCAAVEIVRETEEGRALQALFLEGEEVVTSQLFFAEIANAMGKYVKAGLADTKVASLHMDRAVDLVDSFIPLEENYVEAFSEANRLKHPAYDMFYLTLARRNGATLVTFDKKLIQLCESQGVDCIHQVDFSESI